MEWAEHGDLGSRIKLRAQTKQPFSEDQVLFWFVQICLALWHVHSRNFLHRDLKSQNVFIAGHDVLKLGDFGTARNLQTSSPMARTVVGTPFYMYASILTFKQNPGKADQRLAAV